MQAEYAIFRKSILVEVILFSRDASSFQGELSEKFSRFFFLSSWKIFDHQIQNFCDSFVYDGWNFMYDAREFIPLSIGDCECAKVDVSGTCFLLIIKYELREKDISVEGKLTRLKIESKFYEEKRNIFHLELFGLHNIYCIGAGTAENVIITFLFFILKIQIGELNMIYFGN